MGNDDNVLGRGQSGQTTLWNRLKNRLCREAFITSPLAIAINPVYIVRSGLYRNILSVAQKIKGNVLDFGCGSKPYETLFTNADSYTGVDVVISGHDHKNSKVDFYYDGKTLPFPDNHFDAVVSFEVFEHIFNTDEVISEIRRVLKPGGQLLITIPFALYEHEMPFDFARFTSYGIKHIFEKNKFEVSEIRKTTTFFMAVCQLFISYLTQGVLPKNIAMSRLFQLLLIFPLNLISICLNAVLPKRYELFCNSVILGVKTNN
jgi:SAM-dependent methyltransferase